MRGTDKEHEMLGNPCQMMTMAERRFPVRIRLAVPPDGLGRRHARMTAGLDENEDCGADIHAPQSDVPLGQRANTPAAVLWM